MIVRCNAVQTPMRESYRKVFRVPAFEMTSREGPPAKSPHVLLTSSERTRTHDGTSFCSSGALLAMNMKGTTF